MKRIITEQSTTQRRPAADASDHGTAMLELALLAALIIAGLSFAAVFLQQGAGQRLATGRSQYSSYELPEPSTP